MLSYLPTTMCHKALQGQSYVLVSTKGPQPVLPRSLWFLATRVTGNSISYLLAHLDEGRDRRRWMDRGRQATGQVWVLEDLELLALYGRLILASSGTSPVYHRCPVAPLLRH